MTNHVPMNLLVSHDATVWSAGRLLELELPILVFVSFLFSVLISMNVVYSEPLPHKTREYDDDDVTVGAIQCIAPVLNTTQKERGLEGECSVCLSICLSVHRLPDRIHP